MMVYEITRQKNVCLRTYGHDIVGYETCLADMFRYGTTIPKKYIKKNKNNYSNHQHSEMRNEPLIKFKMIKAL